MTVATSWMPTNKNHYSKILLSYLKLLIEPSRKGQLKWMNDDELRHKKVRLLGHIQQHKDGNFFFSTHLLEEVVEPELEFQMEPGWDDSWV